MVSVKEKEMKVEDVKTPHTLGGVSYVLFLYIEKVVSLLEVEFQKPRNLSENDMKMIVRIVIMGRVWLCTQL